MSSTILQPSTGPVVVSSSHPQNPRSITTNPILQNISEMEQLLHQTLAQCNKLAKSDTELTHEVAAAKMLNYCVRMLHADGWHPPTIVRAMVLREAGLEKGMRSTMYQALRERRQEIETYRMQQAMVPEGERPSLQYQAQAQAQNGNGRRVAGAGRLGRRDGQGQGGVMVGADGAWGSLNGNGYGSGYAAARVKVGAGVGKSDAASGSGGFLSLI